MEERQLMIKVADEIEAAAFRSFVRKAARARKRASREARLGKPVHFSCTADNRNNDNG